MFTQYLAHGSVPLTLVLMALTVWGSYVCLSVLIDLRAILHRVVLFATSHAPSKLLRG